MDSGLDRGRHRVAMLVLEGVLMKLSKLRLY